MSYKEEDMQRIEKALNELKEYFDSVQIFATRYEPELEDGTVAIQKGLGDWYARYGKTKEWIIQEEEAMRIKMRSDSE